MINYKIIMFGIQMYKQYMFLKESKTADDKILYNEYYNNYKKFLPILREKELEILHKYKDKDIEEFEAIMFLL